MIRSRSALDPFRPLAAMGALAACALVLAAPGRAQDLPGLAQGKGEPVTIEADEGIEWNQEKKVYIAPELHKEMLAKGAAVAARREAFWKTLSREEQRKRKFELKTRIKTDIVMRFRWVKDTEGTSVGFPLFIFHITLHDMFPHACQQFLTEEVLLAGLKCNAVSITNRFERIGELEGFHEVQPRWVDEFGEPE